MKKLILVLFLVNAALWSIPAHALIINDGGAHDGENVGVLDILLGETVGLTSSDPVTELEWVQGVLDNLNPIGPIVKWTVETSGEHVPYFSTDATNTFAFELSLSGNIPPTDYFIIKNSTHWALYENVGNIDWGVFDASVLIGFNLGDGYADDGIFTISHVTEFIDDGTRGLCPDGNCATVPEPSISALLGIGLLGMIGVSRRRKV